MMRSKATNASMQMRRERSHNQRTNNKPEAYQMIVEKKVVPNPNAIYSKMIFFFKLCK